MTTSLITECPETWLARRHEAGLPAEMWRGVPKIDGCTFSRYEAADIGKARSLGGIARNGRPLEPGDVSTRTSKTDGYVRLDLRCDNPACKRRGRHTFTMQKLILNTFAGARPRGMQGSHLWNNPSWNWFPEAVAWEDQPTNERRKEDRPAPPEPTFPCRNAPACSGKALNPGRRCLSCVDEVRRQAFAMLDEGILLPEVAAHFGNSENWIWKCAQAAGYKGTFEQAKGLRPPLTGWRKTAARLLGVS